MYNFGLSECNRVKGKNLLFEELIRVEMEGKNENGSVSSPVPIHLNFCIRISYLTFFFFFFFQRYYSYGASISIVWCDTNTRWTF